MRVYTVVVGSDGKEGERSEEVGGRNKDAHSPDSQLRTLYVPCSLPAHRKKFCECQVRGVRLGRISIPFRIQITDDLGQGGHWYPWAIQFDRMTWKFF